MRARRGANAIEFAMLMPVFFGLVLGVFDYSWIFASQAVVDTAVSRGCREGAMLDPLNEDPATEAEEIIRNMLEIGIVRCGGGCEVDLWDVGTVPRRSLVCSVTVGYSPLIGLVPSPDELTSALRVRYEWQR